MRLSRPDPRPQVTTPTGSVALDIPPKEFVGYLDHVLTGIKGPPAPKPPKTPRPPKPKRAAPAGRVRPKPPKPPPVIPPDHNLWCNHGIWFAVFTMYPTPQTKERVRRSLQTRDIIVARQRRDQLFSQLAASGVLATSRQPATLLADAGAVVASRPVTGTVLSAS